MRKIVLLLMSVALVGLVGCNKNESKKPSAKPGQVFATPAYSKYFGIAPGCDKGTAYAFVIFFPSAKTPGKVVPFPFFTFDEGSLKKVAVERLLGGMDIGSYRGEFTGLPAGVRLLGISDDKGLVTVNFSKELDKTAEPATAAALALTLRQFQEVKDIRLQVEGKESPLSSKVKSADESAVQEPAPPRLLSVTATREKGAKDIEDVNAFFDRPVEIKELQLLSRDGQPFAGDLFHSVLDMAAVLKPKDRGQFKEHMPVKVHWKVIDKLGRQAGGDEVWPLEVKEH